jgi:hypothetical protein
MWRGHLATDEPLLSLTLRAFSQVTPEEVSRKAKRPQRKNIKQKKDS